MWYVLVSTFPKVIPNTRSIYTSFDKAITRQEGGLTGYPRIDEDTFVDNVRSVLDTDDKFISGKEQVNAGIQNLRDSKKNYSIPRWHKQLNHVEVWIENHV
jgi:hypothetical protein